MGKQCNHCCCYSFKRNPQELHTVIEILNGDISYSQRRSGRQENRWCELIVGISFEVRHLTTSEKFWIEVTKKEEYNNLLKQLKTTSTYLDLTGGGGGRN